MAQSFLRTTVFSSLLCGHHYVCDGMTLGEEDDGHFGRGAAAHKTFRSRQARC